jgi:hypothetical protein
MKTLFAVLLASFGLFMSGSAFATACAGCAGTCKGSNDAACGCVKIEGCVCCGGPSSTIAAKPGKNTEAQACVKDTAKKDRCGSKFSETPAKGPSAVSNAPATKTGK